MPRTRRAASSRRAVATTVDLDTLLTDLTDQQPVLQRGLALAVEDDRLVAEVLTSQLESSDVVLCSGEAGGTGETVEAVIAHLAGPQAAAAWHSAPASRLLEARPTTHRGDLLAVTPTDAEPAGGVWTVDLSSWRPVHASRLMERAEDLGGEALRSKGHFWVASRPGLACAWDGAAGHVSVGRIGDWPSSPGTRLVVTGIGGDPAGVVEAFEEALLTDVELAGGLAAWAGRPDGLDPWLGDLPHAA